MDPRRGVLRVRIDSEDDLWLLSLLISKGDLVRALTTRDVSLGYEKRRIPMVLTLRVESVEFQPFTNRLRIHGIVVEGPDRFGVKGSHHTISVDVGHEVTVFKEVWSPRLLEELLKIVRPVKLLLVALDFDEYAIALVQSQGVKILDEKRVSLPITGDALDAVRSRFIEELASRILDIASRIDVDAIVVGSPSTMKNELAEKLKEKNPRLRIYIDTVANGGYAGIQELLRRNVVENILRDVSVMEAEKILQEFEMLLVKNPNRVAYGLDYVEKANQMNAIEKLLVLDEALSSFDETRRRVENLLREVAEKRGRIVIVPSDSPPGQRLKMLGGIVAILRFEVELGEA